MPTTSASLYYKDCRICSLRLAIGKQLCAMGCKTYTTAIQATPGHRMLQPGSCVHNTGMQGAHVAEGIDPRSSPTQPHTYASEVFLTMVVRIASWYEASASCTLYPSHPAPSSRVVEPPTRLGTAVQQISVATYMQSITRYTATGAYHLPPRVSNLSTSRPCVVCSQARIVDKLVRTENTG